MLSVILRTLWLAGAFAQVTAELVASPAHDVGLRRDSQPEPSYPVHRSAAQLALSFPDPNVDPFYHVPANITAFKPGQVIRSRQIITLVTGRSVLSYQLFYRTTDHQGNATGTVASVWAPSVPNSPPQVLSYQQAEDALNLDCAPSWAWVNASSVLEASYQETDFLIGWALDQGYYVVVADNEGPTSAWLVGLIEGRASLDAVRATYNYLDLPAAQTEVALFGYSGGGHGSVWASSVAASYAPELKIVGAAYGGTPVDLGAAYKLLNGSPGALLGGGAIVGLANGYPKLNASLPDILTANGTATVAKLRAPNACINAIAPQFAGFNFSTLFKSGDPLKVPVVAQVLSQESLLSNVSSLPVPVPNFPRFEWHGTGDNTVPYLPEAEYVSQQCAKGADIRFLSLPGLDHGPTFIRGVLGAMLFIQQAFSHTLANVTCGANVTVPAIGSAEGIAIAGLEINALLAVASQT